MRTALSLLAASTLALSTAVTASHASTPQSETNPSASVAPSAASTGIQESEGELSIDVQRHVGRGDELSGQLRFAAAAVQYRRAAEIARREGHLPSWTTWKLANAYFNGDNLIGAANALDQLATEAAVVGDLPVQALAIFNSAWLHSKAGHRTETGTRVARLERLLRSPYMPIAIRDHLSGLLKTSRELAVGSAG